MPRNPGEMVAMVLGERREKRDIVFPLKEAQRERLRAMFEHAGKGLRFEPGQFVRYASAGPLTKAAREHLVLMFWRYLDFDSDADQAHIRSLSDNEIGQLSDVDCLLAMYSGDTIAFSVSSSDMLEPDDGGGS